MHLAFTTQQSDQNKAVTAVGQVPFKSRPRPHRQGAVNVRGNLMLVGTPRAAAR